MKTILRKKHMSFISLLLTFTILFLGASRSFAANDNNLGVIESYFNESGDGYEIIKDSVGTLYYFFIEDNIRGVLTCFENGEIKLTYSDTPYEEDIVSVKNFQIDEEDIGRNLLDKKSYMVRQGFPKDEECNREIMTQTGRNAKGVLYRTTLYRSQSYYTKKVKALDVVPDMAVSTIATILGFPFSSVVGVISTIMPAKELVSSVRDVLNVYLTDFEGLKEVYRSDMKRRTMRTAWSGQAKSIIADSRKESFELNYSRKDYDYDGGDLHLLSSAKFRY